MKRLTFETYASIAEFAETGRRFATQVERCVLPVQVSLSR